MNNDEPINEFDLTQAEKIKKLRASGVQVFENARRIFTAGRRETSIVKLQRWQLIMLELARLEGRTEPSRLKSPEFYFLGDDDNQQTSPVRLSPRPGDDTGEVQLMIPEEGE